MKKTMLFIALLHVLISRSVASYEHIEQVGISITDQPQDLAYSINSDLSFEPKNRSFYSAICHELNALGFRFGNNEPIALSNNHEAKRLAPLIFNLLQSKISAIAVRMGLDLSTVTICVQPTKHGTHGVFNAHAQTMIQVEVLKESTIRVSDGAVIDTKISQQTSCAHNLTINAESLKLMLWHERDHQSGRSEGLLDGVLAHELAHIFHNHMECSIDCEFQADSTGAKSLINPLHVIDAVDMLYFAGNIYTSLHAYKPNLNIDEEQILFAINTITSSLVHCNKGFGSFTLCPSHAQFSCNIAKSIGKAIERVKSKKASGNIEMITSLLYDELKDACQTPLPSQDTDAAATYQALDKSLALFSPLTHPDPKSRREHLIRKLTINETL